MLYLNVEFINFSLSYLPKKELLIGTKAMKSCGQNHLMLLQTQNLKM